MRHDPFSRRAAALSLGLHVALLAVFWVASLDRTPDFVFETVQVELVSPPPATQAEEPEPAAEQLRVERPEPEPPAPEPEPEPEVEPEVVPEEVPEPDTEPETEPTPPTPDPEPPEPDVEEEPVTPTTTEEPEAEAEVSGQDINVRLEGLRRDYPAYYENIILQIERCFRPPTGNAEASVVFTLRRDGSAADLDWSERSGNTSFDYAAMEAVECAGRGRFGPLPPDYPYDAIRIDFAFESTRRQ